MNTTPTGLQRNAPATATFKATAHAAPTALTDCTATQLIALFASGQSSPVELWRELDARIAQLNPSLNAFCYLSAESASKSAIESEAKWLAHRQAGAPVGALEGVPVSIKDLILTRGWPTRRGSRTVDPAGQAWDVDAPAVARLREAGAVLIGKTATPEFGCKAETNSPLTGITRNPWDVSKTPGGSSGGAAAAVAAGLGPLALGTDGAGSVRIPASFCGQVGFKPSFGRVPAYPLSPFGTVAHLGPHSRSVRDAALMMNVLKQPDARDWNALQPDETDYTLGMDDTAREFDGSKPLKGLQGLRIAYSATLGYAKNIHPEVAHAVGQAVQRFVDLGAQVEAIDPGIDDPIEISLGLWFLGTYTVWSGLSPAQQALADPDFAAQAELGARYSALDIQQLHLRRGALGGHMRQFMQRYDLLITPTVAIPAFDAHAAGHRPMDAQSFLGWTPFSYPFNLTQQPACTVPCGFTRRPGHLPDGPQLPHLPIGLQIVGPMFGDALVLRAAHAFAMAHPVATLARPMVPLVTT